MPLSLISLDIWKLGNITDAVYHERKNLILQLSRKKLEKKKRDGSEIKSHLTRSAFRYSIDTAAWAGSGSV